MSHRMHIWKWRLSTEDQQVLYLPEGAKILTVQEQAAILQLWALCDPEARFEERRIAIYGTGEPLPNEPGTYIGTVQIYKLVLHVFDATKQEKPQ